MKRIFIAISLIAALAMQAQVMKVSSIERLNVPAGDYMTAQAVAVSPDGGYILLSSDTKQGLVKWDCANATTTTLTQDNGAGIDVRISDDGQNVLYGEVSYNGKLRHQAVKAIDLTSGNSKTLMKPTRHLQGFAIDRSTAMVLNEGQAKLFDLKGQNNRLTLTRPVLTSYHLQMYITRGNATTQLAPNGTECHYIWPSLSPDGTKVLYYVSGMGAMVCNIDGSNVIKIGNITAPKWWNDNTIVGMNETDDEMNIIESAIVTCTLDGQQQTLTGDDIIATYPLPAPEAGKIVFSTPNGEIYMITVK